VAQPDWLTMEAALRHFYDGRILASSPSGVREHLGAGDRAGK
jgi:hypothetical protein